MGTIKEVYDYWNNLDIEAIIDSCIANESDVILDLNKQQMIDGLTANGDEITPKYSENPFFKKPGAAQRYANWKQSISPPSTKRNIDTPNLYINGTFHSLLQFDESSLSINVGSERLGQDVTSVHKNILGLNSDSYGVLAIFVLPNFLKKINESLKL